MQQIDVAADAVTIILDSSQIAKRLGINGPGSAAPLQITVPAKLRRSGMAMRLILPNGESPSSRVDDKLLTAIATAHGWWEELVQNPELRVSDLAAAHAVTKSWITRTLRLAFLDPAIVEQVVSGKAPAHFTLETLRSPESVPTLWSAQRVLHRVTIAR